jgi:hypothetical protein
LAKISASNFLGFWGLGYREDKRNKAQAELQELEKGKTKDKKSPDELESLQHKLENQLESEQIRAKNL